MHCGHLSFGAGDPLVQAIGFGAAALEYASWGFAVVPLERGGKRPHRMLPESGGVHWASPDPEQIAAWWRTDPAASIGVATGAVSRLAVVDCDVKAGQDGPGSFAQAFPLIGQAYAVPGMVQTPSGGLHYWFRVPPGVPVPERPGIAPGVDVKGDGGLVVAPPSLKLVRADGGDVPVAYRWAGSGCFCRVMDLQRDMYEWMRSAVSTGGSPGLEGAAPDEERAVAEGFEHGTRNASLYRLACSMYRRYGLTPFGMEETWRRLKAAWEAGDQGDFSESQLRRVAESARKFVGKAMAADRELGSAGGTWAQRAAPPPESPPGIR